MSDTSVEGFFDNTGGGGPLPSAVLKNVGDTVYGEVVDQFLVDKIKFGTKDVVERDSKTNEPIKQLVVVLQTTHRNWENVVKVPLADKDDPTSGPLDPAQDTGRRAVYVAPWTNVHAAIGDAVVAATGKKGSLQIGAKLGLRITELRDTGKGNPLKIHQGHYEAPAASAGFFGEQNTAGGPGDASVQQQAPAAQPAPQAAPPAQQAPAPAAQPAAQPQGDPWATQPQAAAPAGDPWGNPAQGAQPPF